MQAGGLHHKNHKRDSLPAPLSPVAPLSPPAVAAAASAVDCGAGVPPARGWVGGGESGPMDRYAGRRPTPQERFSPRAPLSGGSAESGVAVAAAASAADCGAGVPPARGWVGGGESGPMDRYAGRRPTPQERFPPRAPLSGGSAESRPRVAVRPHRDRVDCGAGVHACTGLGWSGERAVRWTACRPEAYTHKNHKSDSLPATARLRWLLLSPARGRRGRIGQLIVVRASRLHGAGLEGERAVRWTAMQAGGLHHKRVPSRAPLLRWRWAFEPGSPARHSSRGPRGRIGR